MAAALSARLGPAVSIVVHPVASRGPLAAVWRRLDMDGWSARGLAEQRRNELAAAAFLSELLSVVLAGVLERVDLNAVVARVDLNAVVAGVDLNRVVERLDLDAIVARVDIDAVLRRVDLAAVTEQVIDEVDVGRVIRESSSAMTSETVDTLRVQGMQVDQVLSRIVDRVLLRKGERQTGLGQAPTGEVDP